jgi:excisionase family DNA binding protein
MQYLTTPEVASLLKVTKHAVRQYVRSGEIRASRVGRQYLFDEDSVAEFMASRERPGAEWSPAGTVPWRHYAQIVLSLVEACGDPNRMLWVAAGVARAVEDTGLLAEAEAIRRAARYNVAAATVVESSVSVEAT